VEYEGFFIFNEICNSKGNTYIDYKDPKAKEGKLKDKEFYDSPMAPY
jgi:hypothetical protein